MESLTPISDFVDTLVPLLFHNVSCDLLPDRSRTSTIFVDYIQVDIVTFKVEDLAINCAYFIATQTCTSFGKQEKLPHPAAVISTTAYG
jgi:hypothetical protein